MESEIDIVPSQEFVENLTFVNQYRDSSESDYVTKITKNNRIVPNSLQPCETRIQYQSIIIAIIIGIIVGIVRNVKSKHFFNVF